VPIIVLAEAKYSVVRPSPAVADLGHEEAVVFRKLHAVLLLEGPYLVEGKGWLRTYRWVLAPKRRCALSAALSL
jgi:hypothetical protein